MSGAASIPLSFNPTQPAPDAGKAMTLADLGLQIQQRRQQVQNQNALRNIFGAPGALDPKTGVPTMETMQRILATDPETGMRIQQNAVALQGQQAQLQEHQIKRHSEIQELIDPVRTAALVAYKKSRDEGLPEDAANAAGQRTLTEGTASILQGGFLSEEEKRRVTTKFDYPLMSSYSTAWQQMQEKQRTDARLERAQGETERHNRATEEGGTPAKIAERDVETVANQQIAQREEAALKSGGPPLTDADKAQIRIQARASAKQPGLDATGGLAPELANVHGDDYLKAINPIQAQEVKALAEGRMQFPAGAALRSPYWQGLLRDVGQFDPSFDAVNYNARAATRKDFTSGKSAQNITSFNTAIGHIGRLADSAEKLSNRSFPAWNSLANLASSQVGKPEVNNFNVSKQAVIDELTRSFRGSGGSQTEINEWSKRLDASQSPEQLRGAVKEAVGLLRSRIDAVGEQVPARHGHDQGPGRAALAGGAEDAGEAGGAGGAGRWGFVGRRAGTRWGHARGRAGATESRRDDDVRQRPSLDARRLRQPEAGAMMPDGWNVMSEAPAPAPATMPMLTVSPQAAPIKLTPDDFTKRWSALGYAPGGTAGVMQNIFRESGGDPNATGDGGTSLGLFQHHAERKAELEKFAAASGGSADDPDIQIKFADHEMQTQYPKLRAKLMDPTTTAADAEAAFRKIFERPASNIGPNGPIGTEKFQFSDYAMQAPRRQRDTEMVWMRPQDYLDLTPDLGDDPRAGKSFAALKKSLARGEQVEEIPSLEVVAGEDGAKVFDQDGRNRARAAQEAGMGMIPVAVKRTGKNKAPITELEGMNGTLLPYDFKPVQPPPAQPGRGKGLLSSIGSALIPSAEAAEPLKATPADGGWGVASEAPAPAGWDVASDAKPMGALQRVGEGLYSGLLGAEQLAGRILPIPTFKDGKLVSRAEADDAAIAAQQQRLKAGGVGASRSGFHGRPGGEPDQLSAAGRAGQRRKGRRDGGLGDARRRVLAVHHTGDRYRWQFLGREEQAGRDRHR